MGLLEKFENGGHERSYESEQLYYIPLREDKQYSNIF